MCLVEVIEIDHELALGRGVEAEVAEVGVTADDRRDAGRGQLREVLGVHRRGAAEEGVRRGRHAPDPDGDEPLDVTGVHPESYPVVRWMVERTKLDVSALIGNSARLHQVKAKEYVDDTVGLPTVTDILTELEKPGRDPRPAFRTATFAEGVHKISDLRVGMLLEGVVTNVAAFGAFVDVGVHQDGLVHVSAMSYKFVSDPHEVVRSGEVVKVKVMDVDVARNRIGLSLRLDDEPGQPTPKNARNQGGQNRQAKKRRGGGKPEGRRQASGSMADALKRAGFSK